VVFRFASAAFGIDAGQEAGDRRVQDRGGYDMALTPSAIVNIQLSYIQSACSLIVLGKLSEANIAREILYVRYLRYSILIPRALSLTG
jgi:hypothetical protein